LPAPQAQAIAGLILAVYRPAFGSVQTLTPHLLLQACHEKARQSCDWRALTDHIIGKRSINLFHKLPPRGHSHSYQA
jgi:hypothetical protein